MGSGGDEADAEHSEVEDGRSASNSGSGRHIAKRGRREVAFYSARGAVSNLTEASTARDMSPPPPRFSTARQPPAVNAAPGEAREAAGSGGGERGGGGGEGCGGGSGGILSDYRSTSTRSLTKARQSPGSSNCIVIFKYEHSRTPALVWSVHSSCSGQVNYLVIQI